MAPAMNVLTKRGFPEPALTECPLSRIMGCMKPPSAGAIPSLTQFPKNEKPENG